MATTIEDLMSRERHPLVGKARLIERVGKGGMATVYAGWHVDLEIPVAVKFLVREPDESAFSRFRREARICAALDEPNIIGVLDCGELDGLNYITMEWVPGRSLDAIIDDVGYITENETVTIMRDVAQALLRLHRQEIVHRDIKPANILIRATDGRVKLADLGVARELGARYGRDTAEDAIVGTPGYLSPEQIIGADAVSPRSDLFALGATAFYLLTGRMPFVGKTLIEILDAIAHEPLPRPADYGVAVSERLMSVLTSLTEKDPNKRMPTAEALIDALPVVSTPFDRSTLESAKPVVTIDPESVRKMQGITAPIATKTPATESAIPKKTRDTVALNTRTQSLLFCQSLQNDFIRPLTEREAPPNEMHIGAEEAHRLVGNDPPRGPLVRAVRASAEAPLTKVVYLRDWHNPDDPLQHAELGFFGDHCIMGTDGACFIDAIETFSRDRRSAAVIDSRGLNDYEDSCMPDVLDILIGDADRDDFPIGVVGVWTDVKVRYLLYELKTRGRFNRLATCSALVASRDRAAHESALRHFREALDVTVFETPDELLHFLRVPEEYIERARGGS